MEKISSRYEDLDRRAAIAVDCERLGRPQDAWGVWERLRADYPELREFNGPLVASYLRYALDWTGARGAEDLDTALQALTRALAILAGDLARDADDVTRWILVARALEQRCMLYAFGHLWTETAREAIEAGDFGRVPALQGDPRLVRSAASAAEASLQMLGSRADLAEPLRALLARAHRRIALVRACLDAGTRKGRRPRLTVVAGGKARERADSPELMAG